VDLPVIEPRVLRSDADGVVLLGGYSPSSGLRHFPLAVVCPFTGADDVEPVDLPTEGTVWLETTVSAAPPGYSGRVPYGLGVVALDGEPLLRVVGRFVTDVEPGTRVHLVTEEVPGPEGPALTWAFSA
jgi:uncharacterized OB-fold protein